MKSTASTTKNASKSTHAQVSNYRFWLVLSGAGLIGLWYMLTVFAFLSVAGLINSLSYDPSSFLYNTLLAVAQVFAIYVASVACVPFAVAVFKRLKIQKPVVSAIAFFMAPVFGLNLFLFITRFVYFEPVVMYSILVASLLLAALLYGFAIRPLKHRFSSAAFAAFAVVVSLLPLTIFVF